MIVGITGAAGAGKNTVANILTELYGFEQVAFADALKQSLIMLDPLVEIQNKPERLSDLLDDCSLDIAKNKYASVRKALQDYGVAMRDTVDKDVWVKIVHEKIQSSKSVNICITDLRFENEIKYVMSMNGVIVKVERSDNPLDIGTGHVSEQMIVETPYVVSNNVFSLDDFKKMVAEHWSEWNFKQGYQKRYVANGRACCKICQQWKNVSDFPSDNRMSCGILSSCRECVNKKSKDKPSRSADKRHTDYSSLDKVMLFNRSREKLLASYGLTVLDYDNMLNQQNGVCAICQKQEIRVHHVTGKTFNLAVDHDHETGRVRGLLCTRCNKAIGTLGDTHEKISRVLMYLGENK